MYYVPKGKTKDKAEEAQNISGHFSIQNLYHYKLEQSLLSLLVQYMSRYFEKLCKIEKLFEKNLQNCNFYFKRLCRTASIFTIIFSLWYEIKCQAHIYILRLKESSRFHFFLWKMSWFIIRLLTEKRLSQKLQEIKV